MTTKIRPCMVCPQAVELYHLHVAVTWNVEQLRGGAITVHESNETGWMHLDCARRLGTGQAAPETPAAAAR